MTPRPSIGVFDSGFGGLTVLRALLAEIPGADFIYLGDTAHLPYGSKSPATVTRYAQAAVNVLVERGAELVVIACNTASALALPTMQEHAAVPLVGVIGPGAQAAAELVAPGSTALVLATEATVSSHAYARACQAAGLSAVEKACPLLVPLVEEGWTDHTVTEQVAAIYLSEAFALSALDGELSEDLAARSGLPQVSAPSVVVLGCTHYPLLRPLLSRTVTSIAGDVPIVDSAEATARYTATLVPAAVTGSDGAAKLTFLATDSVSKFQRLGERFLGHPVPHVELIEMDV